MEALMARLWALEALLERLLADQRDLELKITRLEQRLRELRGAA